MGDRRLRVCGVDDSWWCGRLRIIGLRLGRSHDLRRWRAAALTVSRPFDARLGATRVLGQRAAEAALCGFGPEPVLLGFCRVHVVARSGSRPSTIVASVTRLVRRRARF